MPFKLQGQNAIITGAAQGLGKAYAEALLLNGANVCISDIIEDTGLETVAEFQEKFGKDRVVYVKCDVSKVEELEKLWSEAETKLGYISILINNAGLYSSDFKKSLDIMLYGVGEGTKLAINKMGFKNGGKGGRIVSTSSYAGLGALPEIPQTFGYTLSKWGVLGMTRSFGSSEPNIEKDQGIKAYAICPWFVDTKLVRDQTTAAEIKAKYNTRLLEAEEVGKALIDLFKVDKNGSVWAVFPDAPVMEMPNLIIPMQGIYMLMNRLLKIVNIKVDTLRATPTFAMFFVLFYIFLQLLFCILNIIF